MNDDQVAEQYKVKEKTYRFAAEQNAVAKDTSFDLDKNASHVTGISVTGTSKSKIAFRGSLGLRISGDVLFEADTPAESFVSSVGVPAEARKRNLGEVRPGNYKIDVTYTDEDNAIAPWDGGYDVKVTIYYLVPKNAY